MYLTIISDRILLRLLEVWNDLEKLIYLTFTLIKYLLVLSIVRQFVQDLRQCHWNDVMRILKCLNNFPNEALQYRKTYLPFMIQCFVDFLIGLVLLVVEGLPVDMTYNLEGT